MTRSDQKETPPTQEAVYFLSLALEGVRCFKTPQTLDLSDGHGNPAQWTVIMGNNGKGKTTLLQCLALCVPKVDHEFDGDPISHLNEPPPEPIATHVVFTPSKMPIDIKEEALKGNWKCSSNFRVGPNLQEPDMGLRIEGFGFQGLNYSQLPESKKLYGVACFGYGAARKQRSRGMVETVNPDLRTRSLFDETFQLSNAEEWLVRLDYLANKPSEKQDFYRHQRDRAIEILEQVLPDVNGIRFAEDHIGLEFQTTLGSVRLSDLSLGYQTMIAWISDLTRQLFEKYPDSPNPVTMPAVVLIDELDLHLHPQWQRQLMSFLSERFVNTQFIVTAHSPLVAQAASAMKDEGRHVNLVVLMEDQNHIEIRCETETVRGWRVDQILSSDLFGLSTYPENLEKLVQERRTILSKPKLTASDETRLQEIDAVVFTPSAESADDIRAMELIRLAAAELENGTSS